MLHNSVIKSVGRVFELLELFDEVRRPVSVMEVARALDMPQSSTSALLRSMVTLGYCEADATARRYLPTARVTILGSWLETPLFEEGALIRLLNEIHAQTGELVLLTSLSGLRVRHIYVLKAREANRPTKRAGTIRPLGRSGMGNLFLATFADRRISRLVRQINAEEANADYHIQPSALMAEIARIRERGYSVALDQMEIGVGGVNVLLPHMGKVEPMAVAISTLSGIVAERHEAFFAVIKNAVLRNLQQELPRIGP